MSYYSYYSKKSVRLTIRWTERTLVARFRDFLEATLAATQPRPATNYSISYSMKAIIVLAALLIVGAFAQGHMRPQLSNSFTAVVDFQERHGHNSRSFSGNWYMDDTGRQERFNAQSKRGLLDFFRFWNTSLSYGPIDALIYYI